MTVAYLHTDGLDSALEAMSHPVRREILRRLGSGDTGRSLDLSGRALGTLDDVSEASLFHVHLPKLEADGYVEWDGQSLTVEPGPNFEDLEPLLAVLETDLGNPAGNRA